MASPAAVLQILVEANTGRAITNLERVEAQTGRTHKGFGALSGSTHKLTSHLGALAKGALAAGAALVSIHEAKQAVESTEALAKSTIQLQRNFGLTAKEASTWGAVLKANNVDINSAKMSFTSLSKAIVGAGKDSKPAVEAFKRLGISQKDLKGQNFPEVLNEVTTALTNMKGGTDRAQAAQALLGRGAKVLAPLFRGDGLGFKQQAKWAEQYGATLDGHAIKSSKDLAIASEKLKYAQLGLQIAFTEKVVPALTVVAGKVAGFIKDMRDGTGVGGKFAGVFKKIADIITDPNLTTKEKFSQLSAMLGKALEGAVKIAGQFAPKIASALVHGFLAAPALAQLAVGGWLFMKMGGVGAFTRMGEGAAGKFARGFSLAAAGAIAFNIIAKPGSAHADTQRAVDKVTSAAQEANQRALAGLSSGADTGGASIARLARRATELADGFRKASGSSAEMRASVAGLAGPAEATATKFRRVAMAIDDLRNIGVTDLKGLRQKVADNMKTIAENLDTQSAAGKRAISENFGAAVDVVRKLMRSGAIAAKTGMDQINSYLNQELKSLGFSSAQAKALGFGAGATTSIEGKRGRAAGGWVGSPGERGRDTVPLMLPPSAAVLNAAQQRALGFFAGGGLVPTVVGRGEYIAGPGEIPALNARAQAAGYGGLAGLFASVQKPHYAAKGGRVGSLGAMVSTANAINAKHFPYVWGGGHSGFSGPYDCSGAVSAVLHAGGLLNKPMVSGDLANWGLPGAGKVTVVANPQHAYMLINGKAFGTSGQNPGGGAGWFKGGIRPGFAVRHAPVGASAIKRVKYTGPGGALGAVGQRVLDRARGAANRKLSGALASVVGGGGFGGGNVGDAGKAALSKGRLSFHQLIQLAQSVGLPTPLFAHIAEAESGGNPNVVNSIGATGLWQILGHPDLVKRFGNMKVPLHNAQAAAALYRQSGTSPWNASKANWGRFKAKGGFVGKAGHKTGKRTGERYRRDLWTPALAMMKKVWRYAAPYYAGATGFPKTLHIPNTPFVGMAYNPGGSRKGREVVWPDFMLHGTPRDPSNNALKETMIHEWAHYFQRPSVLMSNSKWLAEGGAQAFTRDNAARIYAAAGIPFKLTPSKYDTYMSFVRRVRKEKGDKWINQGQFIGKARGGFVGRSMGAVAAMARGGKPKKAVKKATGHVGHVVGKPKAVGFKTPKIPPSPQSQVGDLLDIWDKFSAHIDLLVRAGVMSADAGTKAKQVELGELMPVAKAAFGAGSDQYLNLAGDLNDLTSAVTDNTDTTQAQNDLLTQQNALLEQQRDDARKAYAVSQTQYGAVQQWIAGIANGMIGGRVGLGLATPSYPGKVSSL